MVLLNEYSIDIDNPPQLPKPKKRKMSSFEVFVSGSEIKNTKTQKKDPVKDELDLITDIQNYHPDLTVQHIRELIADYTRSEIIQGQFV